MSPLYWDCVRDCLPWRSGRTPWIVAELSCNHAGSLERAHRLIDVAADCGADAVKLQTYRPADLARRRGHLSLEGTPWAGRNLEDLYIEARTPWEWHPELFDHARERGLIAFSSAFDPEAVRFLAGLGAPCIKVSGFEHQDADILEAIATAGLPAIVSVPRGGNIPIAIPKKRLALLSVINEYPTDATGAISRSEFRRLAGAADAIGWSDHTVCEGVVRSAVALGAEIFELHLMLNGSDYERPPLDAHHSWEPDHFRSAVLVIRDTARMMTA